VSITALKASPHGRTIIADRTHQQVITRASAYVGDHQRPLHLRRNLQDWLQDRDINCQRRELRQGTEGLQCINKARRRLCRIMTGVMHRGRVNRSAPLQAYSGLLLSNKIKPFGLNSDVSRLDRYDRCQPGFSQNCRGFGRRSSSERTHEDAGSSRGIPVLPGFACERRTAGDFPRVTR
jgi:hypothetical protein